MIIRSTSPVLTSYTIYHQKNAERNYELEKMKENERTKEAIKEETEKIQPIYNTQGKTIANNNRKTIDILV